MKDLYCDTETFSAVPLNHGTHAYAAAAEVMLFTYAFGEEGEVQCWDATTGEPMPDDLKEGLEDPKVLTVWQNGGMFDLTVLHATGVSQLPHERVFDTLVCALAHSLPGSLDLLCGVMHVEADKAKLKSGKKLIHLFCKPQPFKFAAKRKDFPSAKTYQEAKAKAAAIWPGRATRLTHPKEWAEFIEYAKSDITSMRALKKKLPTWNYSPTGKPAAQWEYRLWLLDQKINNRGVFVDLELVNAALEAADVAKAKLALRTQAMTSGEVQAATQRDVLLAHIFSEYGIFLPDMQMATLERRMEDPETPIALKELLAVRLQSSTTSVSKFKKFKHATSLDGRVRGLLQFAGAMRTARWGGRTVQPQNFMRPTLKPYEIELAIEVIKARACELFYDDIMLVLSNVMRGCIAAPPGRKLVVADLANIEGRVAAWLAGEKWKLKKFIEYDTFVYDEEGEKIPDGKGDYLRVGPDLYCVAYGKSFGVDPAKITKPQRQVGKVQELMLQYEGGVGAFVTGAATYRIDLEAMADEAIQTVPDDTLEEAQGFLAWTIKQKRPTFDLSDNVFVSCDALKRLWRAAHPAISSYWGELKDAFAEATLNPGRKVQCRKLVFVRQGAWLRIILPSGRSLCYPSPQVDESGDLSYMGMNQYTKKWERVKTYGGKLFENICQAVARDIMAHGMQPAEDEGYEVVLTIHDELITETPDLPGFNDDGLSAILSRVPVWATGLPLAAAGFSAYRYKKE